MTGSERPRCNACGAAGTRAFYEDCAVPVQSAVVLHSAQRARDFPRGDVRLVYCPHCGFIANQAFLPALVTYGDNYEGSQASSATFNAFHRRLATRLIEGYGLRGKRLVEVGSGRGEFLTLLCDLGGNSGVGFDPSFAAAQPTPTVTLRQEEFRASALECDADLVCSKMTLEHIPDPRRLLTDMVAACGQNTAALLFVQVPSVERILRDGAFWDIYYEHCNYFSAASLAWLAAACGIAVVESWSDYDGQYLMLIGRRTAAPATHGITLTDIDARIERFQIASTEHRAHWTAFFENAARNRERVVLWGAGSKATTLVASLGLTDQVDRLIDINPRKHGTFLPGSGHRIEAPESLRAAPPTNVVVMNPIYRSEVEAELARLGLSPCLTTLA